MEWSFIWLDLSVSKQVSYTGSEKFHRLKIRFLINFTMYN